MAGEPIIRDVILRTRVEYVNSFGQPMPGGSPQPPAPGAAPAATASANSNPVFQQLRLMADIMREDLRMSRDRNRILSEMNGNISRIRTVGGRGGAGQSGGRGANGQAGGIFGQGPLSQLNNLGFQLFITTNSVRMVAGMVTGMASGAADFMNGTPGTAGGRIGDLFNNPARDMQPGGIGHEFARVNQSDWFQRLMRPLMSKEMGDAFFNKDIGRAMAPPVRASQSPAQIFEQARQGLGELAKIEEMRSGKAIEAARTELELIKRRTELAREEFGLSTFEERQASFDIARKIRDRGLGTLTEQELDFVRGRQGFRGAVEKFAKSNADDSGFAEFSRILGLVQEQVQKTQALQELQLTVNVDGVSVTIEKAFEMLLDKFADVFVNQASTAQQRFEGVVNKKRLAQEAANPPSL